MQLKIRAKKKPAPLNKEAFQLLAKIGATQEANALKEQLQAEEELGISQSLSKEERNRKCLAVRQHLGLSSGARAGSQ